MWGCCCCCYCWCCCLLLQLMLWLLILLILLLIFVVEIRMNNFSLIKDYLKLSAYFSYSSCENLFMILEPYKNCEFLQQILLMILKMMLILLLLLLWVCCYFCKSLWSCCINTQRHFYNIQFRTQIEYHIFFFSHWKYLQSFEWI